MLEGNLLRKHISVVTCVDHPDSNEMETPEKEEERRKKEGEKRTGNGWNISSDLGEVRTSRIFQTGMRKGAWTLALQDWTKRVPRVTASTTT